MQLMMSFCSVVSILTSCKRKRELSMACRHSSNLDLKNYYKKYSAVVKEAKKLNYADKIGKSLNKNKAIWDIVTLESNKTGNTVKVKTLNTQGTLVNNHQDIAN
jgi:hypothetical protein